MHGAGGSENMFFETYGAGRLVDLAVERGWGVISLALVSGEPEFRLRRHSMSLLVLGCTAITCFFGWTFHGGGQVVAQASQFPARLALLLRLEVEEPPNLGKAEVRSVLDRSRRARLWQAGSRSAL